MRKLFILAIAALGMLACTEQNAPNNPNAENGALPGKFSVAEGKQVHFSQGNLQYKAISHTWRFAEHQYDYIGENNKKISASYSGWIDLFGWGTGNAPTKHTDDSEDYAEFHEWGANPISNGGNEANLWRTLTYDEWKYLTNTRDNAENLCGQATVGGVRGFVLLPDNWSAPSAITWQGMPNNWTTNQYSVTDWSKMDAAGAVFLPAAGCRRGTDVSNVGTRGDYWSSTPNEDVAPFVYYDLCFRNGYAAAGFAICGVHGVSVRLVRDVE